MKPLKPRRRKAQYQATLVYMDEPQLITLISAKTRIIALAVPSNKDDALFFYATSVSPKNWDKYMSGSVDLRYLFTYPDQRTAYTFDLSEMEEGTVFMTQYLDDAPEEYLPSPRFFESNHTEEFEHAQRPDESSRLFVDGEWELVEFGQFNQRYADIYAFSTAVNTWELPGISLKQQQDIRRPFMERPYQGGFSYVHLFHDLNDNVPPSEQLSLNKIQYASPGYVDMLGKEDTFDELRSIIENYLANRREITIAYNTLYKYLHENRYLQMAGDAYLKGDASEPYILQQTEKLNNLLKIGKFASIKAMTAENALVSAKVVLSFYRRLHELGQFFAQGRVAFEE